MEYIQDDERRQRESKGGTKELKSRVAKPVTEDWAVGGHMGS